MGDSERLQEYERGFRKAGLPMFSEDFSCDSFTKRAEYLKLRERASA